MVMQVVAEVYAAQDIVVRPYILLSLVLYKIVDPHQVSYFRKTSMVSKHLHCKKHPSSLVIHGDIMLKVLCCHMVVCGSFH